MLMSDVTGRRAASNILFAVNIFMIMSDVTGRRAASNILCLQSTYSCLCLMLLEAG